MPDTSRARALPPSVLAPWITRMEKIDSGNVVGTVMLPQSILERLNDDDFGGEMAQQKPREVAMQLHAASQVAVDSEMPLEQQAERDFGTADWRSRVEREMMASGLIQDRSRWRDEPESTLPINDRKDDLFSVRLDNLPVDCAPRIVEDLLRSLGVDYYTKVVVPRVPQDDISPEDQARAPVQYRRFGFVKFDRLRPAIKFANEFPKLQMAGVIISVSLSV